MLGNVMQWTSDMFAMYSPKDASDPSEPARRDGSGERIVARGSTWEDTDVRVSARMKTIPSVNSRSDGIGFRCAVE